MPSNAPVPLSRPDISEEDIQAVVNVLRTPHLSLGPKLPEFEERMAAFVGTKHAVAVSSGTAALHLCLRALDIKDGDEVVTTPFSFIASANCMLFERAVPRFVDIDPETLCIDPKKIEAAITPRTKAVLGVDVFGYLADWDALQRIAKKHRLALIEDSCEALGSCQGNRMAGSFGDCGTFAFYPNKQMTTGEGGMIVTDRDDIAAIAKSLRNQGRPPASAWLTHEVLGFNYRLSDINCALGISQLKRLPAMMERRRQVTEWYAEALAPLQDHLRLPSPQPGVTVSWFVYVVQLADRYTSTQRDALLQHLRSEQIGCNNYFPPIHLQPLYRRMDHREGEFSVTERVAQHTIALPFATSLTREEVRRVCDILADGIHRISQNNL